MKIRQMAAAGLAVALLIPVTTACSSEGDTKCKDYLGKSEKDKIEIMKTAKDAKGASDDTLKLAVAGYDAICKLPKYQDKTLAEIGKMDQSEVQKDVLGSIPTPTMPAMPTMPDMPTISAPPVATS